MIVALVLQLISLLWLVDPLAAAPSLVKPGCPESCHNNNVSIPYPFGIGEGCYHDKWYEITCNQSFNSTKPFLSKFNLEVLNISLEYQNMTVNSPVASNCKNGSLWTSPTDLAGSPFYFSSGNRFTVMGCDNAQLTQTNGKILAGCTSICDNNITTEGCYGINCCQTSIPSWLYNYSVNTRANGNCTRAYAFLLDPDYFPGDFQKQLNVSDSQHAPVVLGWKVKNPASVTDQLFKDYYCYEATTINAAPGYSCYCRTPYDGNPFLPGGCKVVEACALCGPGRCIPVYQNSIRAGFRCGPSRTSAKAVIIGVSTSGGSLLLILGSFWLYKVIRKMRKIKQKKKFFKRNGGMLLQQQISSVEGAFEKSKIFTSKELEKATDNFNENRILGQGGQGTVYKGMLIDGRIVAIKKSKLVDESQLEQFINEVVILSQINHRNVVKLLGCCLETEVPLLVYEFIPNGTLFQLIHDENEEFPLSWEMRLQIAIEVAGAVAYLHSSSSIPIYHRDIKSTNVLLDDKYRAKVADFGTSRSISIEQTHLTTIVQGTFGYLDPEYFQSSQFTDKSDVYSFGVVLVELLTGQKPISSTRSQEEKSLATHFILSLKETRLFDILDARVMKEGEKQEIMAVANLAKRCLNLNGKKRPTMKEVTKELEGSRRSHMPLTAQKNFQEGEYIVELTGPLDGASASTSSFSDYTGTFASNVHPLLHNTE